MRNCNTHFFSRLKDVYSFLFFILSNKAFIGMPLIILSSKFEVHWMTPLLWRSQAALVSWIAYKVIMHLLSRSRENSNFFA